MSRLHLWYRVVISQDLIYKLNSKNIFQINRLDKAVLTCNTNAVVEDSKNVVFVLVLLELLSNQKPQILRAKKSVAAFKLRKLTALGGKVTLRRKKMYNWIDLFFFVVQPKAQETKLLELNHKDNSFALNFGILSLASFPNLEFETNDFIKNLGFLVSFDSCEKKKVSTVLLLNAFQVPTIIKQ